MLLAETKRAIVDSDTGLKFLLERHDWVVAAALTIISGLAWWYIINGANTGMNSWAMTRLEFPPPPSPDLPVSSWTLQYAITMLIMWWVMMIAMMLPSAAPMIILYRRVLHHNDPTLSSTTHSSIFAMGYLLSWFLFCLFATGAQWLLEQQQLLHPMFMWSNSQKLSGLLLLATGLYQLSPVKQSCLKRCRSPQVFISQHWQSGVAGALRMGFSHGNYCIGCCWLLMALLFVGGAMNLLWIAGLMIWVLLEKWLPANPWFLRASAATLILLGSMLLW